MKYYSQYLQDKYIFENLFYEKRDGIFIDIGACDGKDLSNTFFFENELNWSGICFEPINSYFEQLKKNRNSICINAAVADFNGDGKFLEIEGYAKMLSGLVNSLSHNWINVIDEQIKIHGGSKKEIDVNCVVLNDILEKNKIYKVDLCSIDTEGGEFNIIKTIDLNKFDIDVFIIENNGQTETTKNYLIEHGYEFVIKIMNDEIFKKKY
jgi:FkbM family methyltransferase